MTHARIVVVMAVVAFACLAMAFLTSCVSVPIPPFGDRVGELGKLDVKVDVRYVPASSSAAPASASHDFAWNEFVNSRTLRDK